MKNTPLYYLHIPKTAGLSLSSYIESQFAPEEICPVQLFSDLIGTPRESLLNYQLYRGHLLYGLAGYLGRQLRVITMLRDPIERSLSWFAHHRRDPSTHFHARMARDNYSVLDAIRDPEVNWDLTNNQTYYLTLDLDYSRYVREGSKYSRKVLSDYIRSRDSASILQLAKSRLMECAFFGITERLQESLNLLSYRLGFEPAITEPRLNASPNRVGRETLSPETLEALREATQLDQQLYDWATVIFSERIQQMVQALLSEHYSPSSSGNAPWWRRTVPPEERGRFKLEILDAPDAVSASSRFNVTTEIINNSSSIIATSPPNPIYLSYHWLRPPSGEIEVLDGLRTKIFPRLPVGEQRQLPMLVEAPQGTGRYRLRVTMVQEGIAWFDQEQSGVFSEREVLVQ